jgi:hypothetical protein
MISDGTRVPEGGERDIPVDGRSRCSRLGEVAEDGEGAAVDRPACHHAKRHGGQILSLIDNDVPVATGRSLQERAGLVEEREVCLGPSLVADGTST